MSVERLTAEEVFAQVLKVKETVPYTDGIAYPTLAYAVAMIRVMKNLPAEEVPKFQTLLGEHYSN